MQHHVECKDDNHMECSISNTDIFTPVFVQSDIESDIFEDIYPVTNLGDGRSLSLCLKIILHSFWI